jgi:O-antigen/teichoic acid export membrane protein
MRPTAPTPAFAPSPAGDAERPAETPAAHHFSLRVPAGNAANSVATALLQFVGRGALALVAPAFLGPGDYGVYAYSLWLMSVAMQAGQCGLTHSAQRYIPLLEAQGQDGSVAAFLAKTATLSSAVVFGLLLALSHWLQPRSPLPAAVWAAGVLIVAAATYGNIRTAVCQGYGHFGRITRVESRALAVRIAGVALLLALRRHAGILLFLLADLVTQAVRALQLAAPAGRTGAPPRPLPWSVARPLLSYAVTIWSIGLFDMLICQRVEVGFLKAMHGFAAAGYFGLAAQLVFMLVMFPTAAIQAVFPTLASMSAHNPRQFSQASSALLTISAAAAAPLYFAGCAALPAFISVYKHDYAQAIPLIPYLCLGRVLLFVASPLSTSLYASAHHKALLWIVLFTTAPGLLIDYLLIRRFGLMGAGFAVALVQPAVALLAIVVARSILSFSWPLQASTLLAAAAAIGAAACAARHAWFWIPASCALLVYCRIAWRDRNIRALRGAFAKAEA